MATAIGTDHYDLVVRPDVVRIVEDLTWFLDEPFGDASAIPTYMVSKLAAEKVTVVLSGDGGDELFGGYDRYLVEQREQRYSRIPRPARRAMGMVGNMMREGAKGRRFLQHIALDGHDRYLDAAVLFRHTDKARVFQPEAWKKIQPHDPTEGWKKFLSSGDDHWLSDLQYFDTKLYL